MVFYALPCLIFFRCFAPSSMMRGISPLLPRGLLSFFMSLFTFFSTHLFTPCLWLFSTASSEKSPSKDKKQMGSNNIPSMLHCFEHGSVPLLMKGSNWHHSNPCGIRQGCYVAQATTLNCLLGCWANKTFLPGLCEGHPIMVEPNTGQCYSKWGTGKNRWGSPECRNMSIMYKTQSILPLQPSKIMCTTQLSYRTKTTTMPETLMLF